MNPAIIIPTFHQAAADRDKSLAESIYDHPTPLDAPGHARALLGVAAESTGPRPDHHHCFA